MIKCIVEFYGVPVTAPGQKVEIELKEGARLKDIIAALRVKLPEVEGSIIVTGQDKMIDGFTFNIKGKFYIDGDDDDSKLDLKDGDKVAVLTIPIGG
jgi:molybdopterin converting factor small subunit